MNQPGLFDEPPSTRVPIEVIRSKRRKKSSQARMVAGTLQIRIPAWFSAAEERETVEHFEAKFHRRNQAEPIDLPKRAAKLVAEFGFGQPRSVQWVTNQHHQWGSCTPQHGSIRISDRLALYPTWVLDYVLCHELAHLTEPSHNSDFWDLVSRYPLTERARGFLIAKGLDDT